MLAFTSRPNDADYAKSVPYPNKEDSSTHNEDIFESGIPPEILTVKEHSLAEKLASKHYSIMLHFDPSILMHTLAFLLSLLSIVILIPCVTEC